MELVFGFLAGMFFVNSLPHLISGVKGKTHMTPLSKNSSAYVNVVWAFANILLGAWFLNASGRNLVGLLSLDTYSCVFLAGGLFMALADAWLFSNPNARFPWFK